VSDTLGIESVRFDERRVRAHVRIVFELQERDRKRDFKVSKIPPPLLLSLPLQTETIVFIVFSRRVYDFTNFVRTIPPTIINYYAENIIFFKTWCTEQNNKIVVIVNVHGGKYANAVDIINR